MASPKANLEEKKIAKMVMNFIDANSFDPVYDAIEKSEDSDVYIGEILRCVPTGKMIDNLDERGELYEAYKEYAYMHGQDTLKGIVKGDVYQRKTSVCIRTVQYTIPGKPGRIRGCDSEGCKRAILQVIEEA